MTDYWTPPDAQGPERRVIDTVDKARHERGECDNDCVECCGEWEWSKDAMTWWDVDSRDEPQRGVPQ
jgi:hypothetical protein